MKLRSWEELLESFEEDSAAVFVPDSVKRNVEHFLKTSSPESAFHLVNIISSTSETSSDADDFELLFTFILPDLMRHALPYVKEKERISLALSNLNRFKGKNLT